MINIFCGVVILVLGVFNIVTSSRILFPKKEIKTIETKTIPNLDISFIPAGVYDIYSERDCIVIQSNESKIKWVFIPREFELSPEQKKMEFAQSSYH